MSSMSVYKKEVQSGICDRGQFTKKVKFDICNRGHFKKMKIRKKYIPTYAIDVN